MELELKVNRRMKRVREGAVASATYGGLRRSWSHCVTIYGKKQRKTAIKVELDKYEVTQLIETLFTTNSRSDLQRIIARAERAREKQHKERVTPKPLPKPTRARKA